VCKYTGTPIPFWIGLPLSEFVRWIRVNNQLIEEENEKIEEMKEQRRR
jgi:hypothetical protein